MSSGPAYDLASLLVAPLSYFKHSDLDLAGGKGANLGELLNAGFTVPSGFIVTTASYDHLLQSEGFKAKIDDCLASCNFDNSDSVKKRVNRSAVSSKGPPFLEN